jgi:hypothetical protein
VFADAMLCKYEDKSAEITKKLLEICAELRFFLVILHPGWYCNPPLLNQRTITSVAVNLSMVKVVQKVAWQEFLLAQVGLPIGFNT